MPRGRKPAQKVEKTATANKIAHIKKALLEALENSLGVVTVACKTVGITRGTFYRYYNTDPDFATAVNEIENAALDFAESQLHQQIKDNDTTATIFFLKTKGKKRGYVEKVINTHEVDDLGKQQISKLFAVLLKALEDPNRRPVEQVAEAIKGYCRLKGLDAGEIAAMVREEVQQIGGVQ